MGFKQNRLIALVGEDSIRLRANFHCEYCQRDLLDELYEIDHVIPITLGGDNSEDNLALSCRRCNGNKGSRINFTDPLSKQTYSLFNPRKHRWKTHFARVGGEIIGKTPRGAATAALLFRATRRFNPPDLVWDKLEGLERSERLYRFLNDLRYRRLNNQFTRLEAALKIPLPGGRNVRESRVAAGATLLLELERLFTRSRSDDIAKGIRLAKSSLPKLNDALKKEVRLILSIFYQQRAGVRYMQGDLNGAIKDQIEADAWFSIDHKELSHSAVTQLKRPGDLREILRNQAVKTKYTSVDLSTTFLKNLLRASIDLNDHEDFRHFTYLTDVQLHQETLDNRALEALYSTLTQILDESGYGQTIDRARFVTLRRRWWLLHLMLEKDPWLDALIADIDYWRRIRMYNEIREFRIGLSRIVPKINSRNAELAADLVAELLAKRSRKRKPERKKL